MYYKICIALALVATFAVALAFPQEKVNVDELMSEVFGPKQPTTEAPKPSEGTLEDLIDKIFNNDDSKTKTTTAKSDDYLAKSGENCVIIYRPGICTPYYKCGKVVSINDGLLDIAGGQDVICESNLDVCCQEDSIITEVIANMKK